MVAYLELADYLLIAEHVLGVSASDLARLDRIGLADAALNAPSAVFDGKELYPNFETKAAVLCWHLVRNHPLPDGNKRAAFLSLVEFVRRNGHEWSRSPGGSGRDECSDSRGRRRRVQRRRVEGLDRDADRESRLTYAS